MALRTVGVRLTAEIADYQRRLRQAGRDTKDFVGEMDKAARAGHLDAVADSAGVAGLAVAGVAGFAVKSAADFDKSMSKVRAATHASTAEIDKLREAALQAGQDTQFSATGAADAITELAKAGVSTSDILAGGLRGALDLAAAGQLEVGEAAETAASAMTQFKLKGADLPHVADLLAAAAGKAQGSVHDMGMALNQAGLVAAQTGLSIEETTGGLAAFASAGLMGSDAGTSFKQMLLMVQAPSGKTKDLMDDLGISLYDASGNAKGLAQFAGELKAKLSGLTPEVRANAMAQIFGADAVRGASILYEQGAEGIQGWIDKVNDSGYAAETARIQTDNLAGDLERLKGSVETLAIQAGSGANGGLRQLVQIAESMVDAFAGLPPVVGSAITVLAGITGTALLGGAGWIKARRTAADVRAELEAMGPAGAKAATGLQKAGSAATKAAGAFVALQAAGAIVGQFQKDLNPQLEALAVGLGKYAAGSELAGEASRILGKDLGDLKTGFAFLADEDNGRRQAVKNLQQGLESLIPGLDGTNTSLAKTRERITAMDAALAQLVSGGKGSEAQKIFAKLAEQLAVGGVSMTEFRKQFPQYAAAIEAAGAASKQTTGATAGLSSALEQGADKQEEFKSATEAAAAAARGQRDALVQLSDFMKAETDPVFGLLNAQKKLTEAQEAAAKAAKEHGRGSVEAKAATRDLAVAAIDLQKKVGELSGGFDGKMTPSLRETLKAAKLTDAQIRDLEKQFTEARKSADKYEDKYEAMVSAPGAKQSKKELDDAYTAANKFHGPYRADISVDGYGDALGKLNRLSVYQQALKKGKIPAGFHGPIKGPDGKYYADGGWTGPGGKWDEAGIVHADEFVIRKESRSKIEQQHPGALDRMNATGELPPYAAGGRVVWPFPATVRGTRIPSRNEVAAVVVPAAPTSGTGRWMEQLLESRFGVGMISGFRPGSRTLTGNLSYHAMGRAVDFPPIRAMAQFMHDNYKSVLREAITPWQEFNVHNGRSHRYTGAVWRQHNFAGGNAHNHFAMARGGMIREPVFGVGASGATYSLGENWQPERVTPAHQGTGPGGATTVNVTVNAPVGAHPREIGRQVVDAIGSYLRGGGELRINGTRVL